jgi:hypothetical protein
MYLVAIYPTRTPEQSVMRVDGLEDSKDGSRAIFDIDVPPNSKYTTWGMAQIYPQVWSGSGINILRDRYFLTVYS